MYLGLGYDHTSVKIIVYFSAPTKLGIQAIFAFNAQAQCFQDLHIPIRYSNVSVSIHGHAVRSHVRNWHH